MQISKLFLTQTNEDQLRSQWKNSRAAMIEKNQYSSGENGKGKKKGENPGNWDQKLNQLRTKTPKPTSHLSMEKTDSL